MTNALLRDHITRVGFDLTLTKTQIAVLVYLDLLKREVIVEKSFSKLRQPTRPLNAYARMIDSSFVTGVTGLTRRGLVRHYHDGHKHQNDDHLLMFYTVLKAGEYVIGLLKESGLYEQYATPIAGAFRPERVAAE